MEQPKKSFKGRVRCRHPFKMQRIEVGFAKGSDEVTRQVVIRSAATAAIQEQISAGKQFLRTESQNNKIRAFFADKRIVICGVVV